MVSRIFFHQHWEIVLQCVSSSSQIPVTARTSIVVTKDPQAKWLSISTAWRRHKKISKQVDLKDSSPPLFISLRFPKTGLQLFRSSSTRNHPYLATQGSLKLQGWSNNTHHPRWDTALTWQNGDTKLVSPSPKTIRCSKNPWEKQEPSS